MNIEFIPISKPSITDREIAYITDAAKSGWVSSLGEYINKFECNYAIYCGTKYALTTSNGTTALHLALLSIGLNPNDEVIIPDLTFIATANAVSYTGAKCVQVDIDKNTLCIDPEKIKKAITNKTKAIIAVHLYGHPADMDEINKIAKEFNLYVIEDAAEAHGATINNKKVGGLSDVGIFSLYGNKIITSGEGGIITTNNKKLYDKMKLLRDHAMSKKKRYWHTEIGYNYRMTNIQAALGLAQLERIDNIILKKRMIFEWYCNGLKNDSRIKLNYEKKDCKNVYWMVCVEINKYTYKRRNALIKNLALKGIETRPFFYPISDMPMYKSSKKVISQRASSHGINLPSFFDINEQQVKYVCDELIKAI